MHNSKPIKQAALAGKARSITGTTPLYRARGPSSFIKTLKTSRIPLGNVPSGAKTSNLNSNYKRRFHCLDLQQHTHTYTPVCSLLLSTSAGIATSQLAIPALPPANMVLRIPIWPVGEFCDISLWINSYVMKYIPLAGTSEKYNKISINCLLTDKNDNSSHKLFLFPHEF